MRLHMAQELLVDPLGGASQRQLPQGGQVSARKVMADRPLGLVRDVDLSFLQPLEQIVGRQVDELDIVSIFENGIGDRLTDPDVRDLRDDVVEAFDVLDIERGIDVDAGAQQLLHIEIALGMAAAGRVGMGQLIDKRDLRLTGEQRVEVHFLKDAAPVFDFPAWKDLQALEEGLRLHAAVGLDNPDDHIDAVLPLGARRLQHLEGFAHPRRRAEEDLEPAASAFLAPSRREQRLRRRSLKVAAQSGHAHPERCDTSAPS